MQSFFRRARPDFDFLARGGRFAGQTLAMPLTVLHYVGYDDDHSGVVSVVRALAAARRFECVLGVNPGCVQHRPNPLPSIEFAPIAAETIGPRTMWRARTIARQAGRWLAAAPDRVFHGHSRAGLLAALWLQRFGEKRVVATVHSFGRQRWFYRWAARRLQQRLNWLSPAMKVYYGIASPGWEGCIPNSLPADPQPPRGRALEAGRLVIGGAGMIVRWKRWDLMLDAIAALPPALKHRVEFQHVGADDGSPDSKMLAAELARQTERLGLRAQVKWLGWEPAIERWLQGVDCVAVVSQREPFSMIALEALFAGVPVIAADEGGPKDFVTEGASGWFFRSGEARDLARLIQTLLETGAVAAVDFAPSQLDRFKTAVVTERWREVYQQLIASTAR